MKPWTRSSLRARLVAIPSAAFSAGLLATVAVVLASAPARVAGEVDSGMRLGHTLLRVALQEAARAPDPEAAYRQLEADLPHVRHVRLFAAPRLPDPAPPPSFRHRGAPSWLIRLLAPTIPEEVFPLPGGRTIVMQSDPDDEVREVWGELVLVAAALLALWSVVTLLLGAAVRLSLRPLLDLADAFQRLERGEDMRLPPIPLRELAPLGRSFNSLAAALARMADDNHLLVGRLMSVQDAERREVAHELHDQIGPLLFGIRTDATCILRWAEQGRLDVPQAVERARSIAELVQALQRSNYGMLEKLRPLTLDSAGLEEALRQAVAAWRTRNPEIFWSLRLEGGCADLDEPTSLTLYRSAQEAMTNAARHGAPNAVSVTLTRGRAGVRLTVRDDGSGFPEGTRYGFGLLGMAERARRLGGSLSVTGSDAGTQVTLAVPVCTAAAADAAC